MASSILSVWLGLMEKYDGNMYTRCYNDQIWMWMNDVLKWHNIDHK